MIVDLPFKRNIHCSSTCKTIKLKLAKPSSSWRSVHPNVEMYVSMSPLPPRIAREMRQWHHNGGGWIQGLPEMHRFDASERHDLFQMYCSFNIWVFPKIGVPPNHPF